MRLWSHHSMTKKKPNLANPPETAQQYAKRKGLGNYWNSTDKPEPAAQAVFTTKGFESKGLSDD